jgi:hypothetical protein
MSKENNINKEIKVIQQIQEMAIKLDREVYSTIRKVQKFKDFDVNIAPFSLSEKVLLGMQSLITKYQLLRLQRKLEKEHLDAN